MKKDDIIKIINKREMSKGKRREKKDSNAPKRALSPFLYYTLDRRPELKKEKPELSHKELLAEMGVEWNKLKEEEKKKYIQKADEDKKRYEREKAAYDAKVSGKK